jgi:hypothetical protein
VEGLFEGLVAPACSIAFHRVEVEQKVEQLQSISRIKVVKP